MQSAGAITVTSRRASRCNSGFHSTRPATRRRFFTQAIRFAVRNQSGAVDQAPEPERPAIVPWPSRLPEARDPARALYPQVPVIDAERCNGCDACVRLCPHQALLLDEGGSEPEQAPAYLDTGAALHGVRDMCGCL
ncbi:MAG: 4Fe-4S binding protein [Thiolinea sp.]